MSRIGKLPIVIPSGVTIDIKDNVVTAKGPKGELSQKVDPSIILKNENGHLVFEIDENSPVETKQNVKPESASNIVNVSTSANTQQNFTQYKDVIAKVVSAIEAKRYTDAYKYFTLDGREMYDKLVGYGKGRIICPVEAFRNVRRHRAYTLP